MRQWNQKTRASNATVVLSSFVVAVEYKFPVATEQSCTVNPKNIECKHI